MGLVFSPCYGKTLHEIYDDSRVTGGYQWQNLHMGVRFNLCSRFRIMPGLDFLYGSGLAKYFFVNAIALPHFGVQVTAPRAPSFYLTGQVHYAIPYTTSDRFDGEGNVGGGAMLGYDFGKGFHLEIGYQYVAVTVFFERVVSRDFGGFWCAFKYAF